MEKRQHKCGCCKKPLSKQDAEFIVILELNDGIETETAICPTCHKALVASVIDMIDGRKPHGVLIDRDELLKHPFLCGKFDRENADPHFIYGCETIGEYIRLLPAIVPGERKGDNDDE